MSIPWLYLNQVSPPSLPDSWWPFTVFSELVSSARLWGPLCPPLMDRSVICGSHGVSSGFASSFHCTLFMSFRLQIQWEHCILWEELCHLASYTQFVLCLNWNVVFGCCKQSLGGSGTFWVDMSVGDQKESWCCTHGLPASESYYEHLTPTCLALRLGSKERCRVHIAMIPPCYLT